MSDITEIKARGDVLAKRTKPVLIGYMNAVQDVAKVLVDSPEQMHNLLEYTEDVCSLVEGYCNNSIELIEYCQQIIEDVTTLHKLLTAPPANAPKAG